MTNVKKRHVQNKKYAYKNAYQKDNFTFLNRLQYIPNKHCLRQVKSLTHLHIWYSCVFTRKTKHCVKHHSNLILISEMSPGYLCLARQWKAGYHLSVHPC